MVIPSKGIDTWRKDFIESLPNGDGVMRNIYYVINKVTNEVGFVELGARYDQSKWTLCQRVDTTKV